MNELMRLLKLFDRYRAWIIIGILVALFSALANILLMGASGWFITAMGLAGVGGAAINYFTPAAIIRACAIVRTGGRYGERLLTHEATFRIISRLRLWFYSALEPHFPAVLGRARGGDMLSRVRADIDTLERFYLGFIVPISVAVLSGICITLAVSFYSLKLAVLVFALFAITIIILPLWVFKKTYQHEGAFITDAAQMRAQLAEELQGAGELLVYEHVAQSSENNYETLSNKLEEMQNRVGAYANHAQNAVILLCGFAVIATIYLMAPNVEDETLSKANLVMLALLIFAAIESVGGISAAFQGLGRVIRAAKRIFEIVDKPVSPLNDTNDILNSEFSLEFRNVHFKYNQDNAPIFKNLSFKLKENQKICILGPSGAGKSTIIDLIFKFWVPNDGDIVLNGEDLCNIAHSDINKLFSVAPQIPYVFNKTIKDNLHLANPNATDKDIDWALDMVELLEDFRALPKGLQSYIGEHGKQLSGGQLKRLSLARALINKDAKCLILDEPGEALDYKMEQRILERVFNYLDQNEKSLILITHRRAGIDKTDLLIDLSAPEFS